MNVLEDSLTDGPNLRAAYRVPKLVYKNYVGPSISTPILVNNKLIAATYNGIYLFEYNENLDFQLLDKFEASFESTPVAFNNKVYVASRNGYLYCFGN